MTTLETIPAFSKCACQMCNAHLEFETARAGETATCPHCNLDTILFIPRTNPGKPRPDFIPASRALPKRVKVYIAIGTLLAIIGALAFKYQQTIIHIMGAAGIAAGGLVAIAIFVFCLFVAVLWIIFPLFVYFGMERQEKILRAIERNTRP